MRTRVAQPDGPGDSGIVAVCCPPRTPQAEWVAMTTPRNGAIRIVFTEDGRGARQGGAHADAYSVLDNLTEQTL